MYNKGEVVWAKIKGFPWWPGLIAKVVENKESPTPTMEVLVNFIGENSHAQLSLDKVAKYQENYTEFAKMKKKKLLESIESADRIFNGLATYEDEVERMFMPLKEPSMDLKLKSSNSNKENIRRKKDSKSFDDNESNDFEGDLAQYESGHSSDDGDDQSTSDKERKKTKSNGTKGPMRKTSFNKNNRGQNSNKSPVLNKIGKTGNNKRRLIDEDSVDLEESKPVKNLKIDRNLDEDRKSDTKILEETQDPNNKQVTKLPILSNVKFSGKAEISNNAGTSTQTSPVNAVSPKNNSVGPLILNNKDFDSIYNLIIDKTSNYEASTVSASAIESSIEKVMATINVENITVEEIVENDLGKKIFTMLVLLEELSNSIPETGMNVEFEFVVLRDKLIKQLDIIKHKVIQHYVDNNDHCTFWLKKLASKKVSNPAARQDKNKAANKSNKMLEESKNGEGNHSNGLAMNFEDYRYENDNKKNGASDKNNTMVTTSTKINKPDIKKPDNKTKEIAVVNAPLRKKICVKMCKILQEKYKLEKEKAQEATIKIEGRVRMEHPDMEAQYKERILIVLKLLKYSLMKSDDVNGEGAIDFKQYKKTLEAYQREHGEAGLDGAFGDSPESSKDISRDFSLVGNR